MNGEIEEIKQAVERYKNETKPQKAELLGIKFITSEKGADLLNEISRVFDLVEVKQKDSKKELIDQGKKVHFKVPIDFMDHTEYLEFETTEAGLRHFKQLLDPNKDPREYDQAVEMENLSFYDGVILVWEIFERTIHDYFDEDDKDAFGYRYDLGLMDKMQDILSNEVLNKIENLRKEHLHELFIMKSDLYKRPAWMRSDKNCIDTKPNQKIVSMQQK